MSVSLRPLALALLLLVPLLPPRPVAADPDAYTKRLTIADPDELYAAIVDVGGRRDPDAVLALLDTGIQTQHPHLAIACGEALAMLPREVIEEKVLSDKQAARALEKAIDKALKDNDVTRQKNLARVLGTWGHPLVDEPMADLASGRRKPEVQCEALFLCGGLLASKEAPFAQSSAAILKAIDGRSEEVQCAACSAAGRRKMSEAEGDLISIVKRSTEDYVGLYAVWALKQMGYGGGIGSFIHVLEKGSPKKPTMQANLKAITELSTIKEVEDLLSLSRSSKKDYRDAAVLALGRLAWRTVHQKPGGAADGGQGDITPREGEPAKPERALADPQLDVPDKVIDRMIQIVGEDGDWEVRDAARQALLRFGKRAETKVLAAMPGLVNANSTDVQLTAIELCGLFKAPDAFRSLIKIAMFDKDRTKRMFAARALEGVDPAKTVEELTKAIKPRKQSKDEDIYAVHCLGYIRDKASYDLLIELVKAQSDYSEDVLRVVELSLERLTGHRFGRKPERWSAWFEKTPHPFHTRVKGLNRQKNRQDATEKRLFGLTQITEKAVEDGIRWLEMKQRPLGLWDGNEQGFGGVIGCEPAYTGLSLLAMVGAGYHSREGKYHETIRRAVEFLAATQFYDGGFPVTGGGDESWIFAYLIGMGIWGITETYGLSGDPLFAEPAQWGIDYLVRVQTPGSGWRYGPRYFQSDTSCTSWVLMTTKMADLIGLDVAQKSWDGIDSWLDRCSFDITGEEEVPDDLATDYDYEVGARRYFKAFTGYLELSGAEKSALQQTSMTAVGMVCRFFMGWKRSHPFMIGSANYLLDYLPRWMAGLEKGMAVAWYHYYWYYGTLAMYQMGGRYWKAWNEKIKHMYPDKQRKSPPDMAGSWDPDTAVLNGGRLFSTAMSIMALESYYRFSPLLGEETPVAEDEKAK